MIRLLKAALLLVLLALVPLRGIAAATVGVCAATEHAALQAEAGQAAASHHQALAPQADDKAECNACEEHCPSPAFLTHGASMSLPSDAPGSIRLGHPPAAGFVPEHLDPPPLAL